MKTVTVELTWDDEDLGPEWLNPDNLDALLYGKTYVMRELLQVTRYIVPEEKKPPILHFEWTCCYCGAKRDETSIECPCGGVGPCPEEEIDLPPQAEKENDMMQADNGAEREMPKYKCHKVVHALKIAKIVIDGEGENCESDGSAMITPVEDGFAPFKVDREYVRKHKPEVGGYYVVYEDGYVSWSPGDVFEDGYEPIR